MNEDIFCLYKCAHIDTHPAVSLRMDMHWLSWNRSLLFNSRCQAIWCSEKLLSGRGYFSLYSHPQRDLGNAKDLLTGELEMLGGPYFTIQTLHFNHFFLSAAF